MNSEKARKSSRREQERELMRQLAARPETVDLFERAHHEPHIKGMEATAYGMRVEFQGLGVKHVNMLLDVLDRIRVDQVAARTG